MAARDGQQRAGRARRVQGADKATFGTQGQAVGGVLHVAAGDDVPAGGLGGGAHPESGVRSVRPSGGRQRSRAQSWPVDDHLKTLRPGEPSEDWADETGPNETGPAKTGVRRYKAAGLPYTCGPSHVLRGRGREADHAKSKEL